jgi:hypothetical protein
VNQTSYVTTVTLPQNQADEAQPNRLSRVCLFGLRLTSVAMAVCQCVAYRATVLVVLAGHHRMMVSR